MPQLTLEYSSNIADEINYESLFDELHKTLSEVGEIKLENFKSRAIEQKIFYVGDGNPGNGFVHVEFKLLEGRENELKNKLGQTILETLRKYLSASINKINIQITVELIDIIKSDYYKYPDNL